MHEDLRACLREEVCHRYFIDVTNKLAGLAKSFRTDKEEYFLPTDAARRQHKQASLVSLPGHMTNQCVIGGGSKAGDQFGMELHANQQGDRAARLFELRREAPSRSTLID